MIICEVDSKMDIFCSPVLQNGGDLQKKNESEDDEIENASHSVENETLSVPRKKNTLTRNTFCYTWCAFIAKINELFDSIYGVIVSQPNERISLGGVKNWKKGVKGVRKKNALS